jgi:phosphoglycolate phosphatase
VAAPHRAGVAEVRHGFEPDRVRGVVFDLDGTLVDSYSAIADSLNRARGAFGLAPLATEEVRRRVGWGLETLVAELVGSDRVEEGVRLFRERYGEIYATHTTPLPGAVLTLETLAARGLRLAVASNKPARFSRPMLRGLGMLDALCCVTGPDTVGRAKPDPTMIRHCLDRMGLPPEDSIYVGDMALDVESGARAGLPVVLVASGSCEADELARTGRPVIRALTELLDLLAPTPRR